jgi:hypothetical protein
MMTNGEQRSITRRDAFKGAAAGAVAAGIGVLTSKEAVAEETYDAIVIGTGFGGTIATIALSAHGKKTLVIERGTFFVTPERSGPRPLPATQRRIGRRARTCACNIGPGPTMPSACSIS